jgi:probable addiction module antidote protein
MDERPPKRRRRKNAPLDIADALDKEEVAAEFLTAAAEDENPDVLLAALGDVAKARAVREIAEALAPAKKRSARKATAARTRPAGEEASTRDYVYTLSDVRTPALSIECELCGRADRYDVAKLIEQYGDASLPDLLHQLADCPKARSVRIHVRCKVTYGKDTRWST